MEKNIGLVALILPIIAGCFIIFTFIMILSPKLRAKWMSRQIKVTKYMLEKNEEDLRDLAAKGANIAKDGVKITSGAVNDGFSSWDNYCKHCGAVIDADSIYCKKCGRKQ